MFIYILYWIIYPKKSADILQLSVRLKLLERENSRKQVAFFKERITSWMRMSKNQTRSRYNELAVLRVYNKLLDL